MRTISHTPIAKALIGLPNMAGSKRSPLVRLHPKWFELIKGLSDTMKEGGRPVSLERLGELLAQDFLGAAVGGGNEIGRSLERDL